MKISQVAAQLYTLRDYCKTESDIASTLERVSKIGYQAVQASALGPIAEEKLVQLCRDNGLTLCATHEPSTEILETPEVVVERLKKLECKYTAYPYPAGIDLASEEGITKFIADLENAGRVLAEAGQYLTYHNHHHEFRKVGGKTIFSRIFDETDPKYLGGEPDTYWVQYGGSDPAAWCRKLKGRLPLLHLKDYGVNAENQPYYCEIGNGNLDFKTIIAAAEESGCEWFIVEQDTTPGDPFDSLQISFNYISENLAS